MKKSIFLVAFVAVAAMTSCSKDDSGNAVANQKGKEVEFRVLTDKTRATQQITLANIKEFTAWASYLGNTTTNEDANDWNFMNTSGELISLVGGVWKPNAPVYWPNETLDEVQFFAIEWNGSAAAPSPTIATNTDTDVDDNTVTLDNLDLGTGTTDPKQGDLLIASTKVTSDATVALTFNHALVGHRLVFKNTTQNGAESIIINSVSITNLANKGKLEVATDGTVTPTTTTPEELDILTAAEAGVKLIAENGANTETKIPVDGGMLVSLPQAQHTYDIKFNYTVLNAAGEVVLHNQPKTVPVKVTNADIPNEAGKVYVYEISLTANGAVQFNVTVNDWANSTPSPIVL
jgi:hypothetical protein